MTSAIRSSPEWSCAGSASTRLLGGTAALEAASYQRARGGASFNVRAGEIHAADRAITCVWSKRRADDIELRIENVLAMLPCRKAVIDDESDDDVASVGFTVRQVFAPGSAPFAVTTNPTTGIAPITAVMPFSAARLIRAMIGGCPAHSRRQCEGGLWASASQESDGIVEGTCSFLASNTSTAGHHVMGAVEIRTHFFDVRGVKRWILPRHVHLAHQTAGCYPGFFSGGMGNDKGQRNKKQKGGYRAHYSNYKQARCHR